MNIARALSITVVLIMCSLLVVSYDATREIGALFHSNATLPFLFAFGVDIGVVGCAYGRAWSSRRDDTVQKARAFARILSAMLVLSFVASGLAGAHAFPPDSQFLQSVGLPSWLRWPLILAFAAVIPVLVQAFADLLALLMSEQVRMDNASDTQDMRVIAQPPLRVRITELYSAHPELPATEAARILECNPATVRRVRAQISTEKTRGGL